MQNLVQLQASLQNLGDEELQQEMQSPSGVAPPYLVLTEMQRRENMRNAYQGEMARFQEKQPTVAQRFAGGALPAPEGTPMISGLSAMRPMQKFQEGGIVSTLPPGAGYRDVYEQLLEEYGGRPTGFGGLRERLSAMEKAATEREDDAIWLALMRAGLATAASDSPYVWQALGEGGVEGLTAYEETLDDVRAENLERLALEADLTAQEEAQVLARVSAAQTGAAAQTSAVQADRAFELAQDEFAFSKDEADRVQQDRDRQYSLLVDQFDFEQDEAARAANQRAIDNALNERRVAIEEARLGQPPAQARFFDYYLGLDEDDQNTIMQFVNAKQGANYTRKDFSEATRLWGAARKAVTKELEEDLTYIDLINSDDPLQQAEAEKMKFERIRERFVDDAPRYADLVDLFGRATADQLAQTQANRGLNIVGAPAAGAPVGAPPPGATVLPLEDVAPGVPETPAPEAVPGPQAEAPETGPPAWFADPGYETLLRALQEMEVEERGKEETLFTEPGYRPILRGLRDLVQP